MSGVSLLVFPIPYNFKITIRRIENMKYVVRHRSSSSRICHVQSWLFLLKSLSLFSLNKFYLPSRPSPGILPWLLYSTKPLNYKNTSYSLFWQLNITCHVYLNFLLCMSMCGETISFLKTETISYNSTEVQTYTW